MEILVIYVIYFIGAIIMATYADKKYQDGQERETPMDSILVSLSWVGVLFVGLSWGIKKLKKMED